MTKARRVLRDEWELISSSKAYAISLVAVAISLLSVALSAVALFINT